MHSQQTKNTTTTSGVVKDEPNEKVSWVIVGFIIITILVSMFWFLSNKEDSNTVSEVSIVSTDANTSEQLKQTTDAIQTKQTKEKETIQQALGATVIDNSSINTSNTEENLINSAELSQVSEEPVVNLPALDDSDVLVKDKLPELTLKAELLKLFITEDIIRRFVVFTDNFTRGSVAYEHSLFVPPNTSFFANESFNKETKQTTIEWNKASSERFSLYVDLFRSLKTKELVAFYAHVKPLIDQAYQEIGYEKGFTETLQLAIKQVLNAKMPEGVYELSRTSVMFTYKNDEIESLSDAQKILLRIGEDNIILMKSVLLDINGQLSKLNS